MRTLSLSLISACGALTLAYWVHTGVMVHFFLTLHDVKYSILKDSGVTSLMLLLAFAGLVVGLNRERKPNVQELAFKPVRREE